MRMEITSRIAALLLVAIFLSNDVLASVHALSHGIPEVKNVNDVEATWLHPTPIPAPSRPKKSPRVDVMASQQVAHLNDGANRSEDDIFNVELDLEQGDFQYAYLSYEVKGVANAEDLPKALNNQRTYGSDALTASNNDEWKSTRIRIALDDIQQGSNTIRFSVPEGFHYPVQVKNVSLSLMESLEEREQVQRSFERKLASTIDFQVMDSASSLQGYVASRAEIASIPNHIVNITRNAPAYQLEGDGFTGYHVAIGVDASMLKTQSDLNQAQVFFFDRISRSWKTAHTVKVDRELLRIEAMVPGETDYFAGLIKSPDMPEASAYVPTNISDIEPANPATGMRLMQAPQINRSGSASINYPLWIPQGRNGMTPPVSVSYNSDAGTGWMGMGWNIGSSSISVDTKLGVPRFDPAKESEGYVLDGQELYMEGGIRPNRTDNSGHIAARTTGDQVHFLPKVVNSYQEIIRHKSATGAYFWEIIGADQMHRFYGSLNGTTVDNGSVLRADDANSSIATWYLTKVVDKWGNEIEYEYATSGTEPTSSTDLRSNGKYKYLSAIYYTGFNQTRGKYSVHFTTSDNRVDATVNLKKGFKHVDDRRLDEVVVKYDGGELVKYIFKYQTPGATNQFKTVLESIEEHRGGSMFYEHTFDYYQNTISFNESADEIIDPLVAAPWIKDSPNWTKRLLSPLYEQVIPSAIGNSISIGGSFGIGLGYGFQLIPTIDKQTTLQLGVNYAHGNTKTGRQLRDMDGNGIPDIVFDDGDKLVYRPVTRSSTGDLEVGYERTINASTIQRSVTNSFSTSVDFTHEYYSLYYGRNWNWTYGETKVSQVDYNQDGILDLLVKNGDGYKVKFGEYGQGGDIDFNFSSENTFSPVVKAEDVITPAFDNTPNKEFEIVRVWKAYKSGTVQIRGAATMQTGGTGQVRVAVQKNGQFIYPGNTYGTSGTTAFKNVVAGANTSMVYDISVVEGDILMFRTQADVDGQGDFVKWNPTVKYLNSNEYDGSGIKYWHSSYGAGFMLSGPEAIYFAGDEELEVLMGDGELNSGQSDDIIYTVEVYHDQTLVDSYNYTLAAGNTLFTPSTAKAWIGSSHKFSGYTESDKLSVRFKVWSASNVHWSGVRFNPVVRIRQSCAEAYQEYFPVADFQTYNNIQQLDGVETDLSLEPLNHEASPQITQVSGHIDDIFPPESAYANESARANFVVKSGGTTLAHKVILFSNTNNNLRVYNLDPNGQVGSMIAKTGYNSSAEHFSHTEVIDDEIYFEFYAQGPYAANVAQYIEDYLEDIHLYDENGVLTVVGGGAPKVNIFYRENDGLNVHHRLWGQFGWSPADGEKNQVILRSELKTPAQQAYENGDDFSDPNYLNDENTQNGLNPLNQEFFPMRPLRGESDLGLRSYHRDFSTDVRTRDRWTILGDHIASFRSVGNHSPGWLGEMEDEEDEFEYPQGLSSTYTAQGISHRTRSYTQAQSGPGAGPLLVSYNLTNKGKYFSYTKSSFRDLNGDGYPDVIKEIDDDQYEIQYTNPTGGHLAPLAFSLKEIDQKETSNAHLASNGAFINNDLKYEELEMLLTPAAAVSFGSTTGLKELLDLNGDGLPDEVQDNGTVKLNEGYSFGSALTSTYEGPENSNISVPLGVSHALEELEGENVIFGKSYSFGLGINFVGSEPNSFYIDMNGDGLIDKVVIDDTADKHELYLNTGRNFVLYNPTLDISDEINRSHGLGLSLNGTWTFAIGLGGKLSLTFKGAGNMSVNRVRSAFQDMNGDGLPDFVYQTDLGQMEVYYNQGQKANKLMRVNNPLGGSFTVDYELVGNQVGFADAVVETHMSNDYQEKVLWDMPNAKWVMSSLSTDDGLDIKDGTTDLDGEDVLTVTFAYDGGIYSRREKEFIGFTRLATISPDHRGELIDHCEEYGIASSRPELPLLPSGYISADNATEIVHLGIYNSEVMVYYVPATRAPEAMVDFEYRRNELLHSYSLHIHKWKEIIEGSTDTDPVEDYREELNHQHIELMNDDRYEYEYRQVENNGTQVSQVAMGSGSTPVVVTDFSTLGETSTVFPAVIGTEDYSFPDITDRVNYIAHKYEIEYDEYFNVIRYKDFGEATPGPITDVVIGTQEYYEYDYKTQANACFPTSQPWPAGMERVDGYEPFVGVKVAYIGPETGYSDGVKWFLDPDLSTTCVSMPAVMTYPLCGIPDESSFITQHTKLILNQIDVYERSYGTTYNGALIAEMDYWSPANAASRTNAIQAHRVYQGSTANPPSRKTEVSELTTNALANKKIRSYYTPTLYGESILTYDNYGNVTLAEGPENYDGDRTSVTVTYDGILHQFPLSVVNHFGEKTASLYDFGYQQLRQTTDVNGHPMRYVYDNRQRLTQVWAPRELYAASFGPTVAFAYHPEGINPSGTHEEKVPVALTYHNTANSSTSITSTTSATINNYRTTLFSLTGFPTSPTSSVATATLMDGAGKVVQIQSVVDSDVDLDRTMEDALRVSGFSEINRFGQNVNKRLDYLITSSPLAALGKLNIQTTPEIETIEYDYLNRPKTQATVWSESTMTQAVLEPVTYTYAWRNDLSTGTYFTTRTERDGQEEIQYVDSRGRSIATKSTGGILTKFKFDDLGQMTKMTNPVLLEVDYTYDMMGRVTQEVHPDRGTSSTVYDAAGNVISVTVPSGTITYNYNRTRLTSKSMPPGSPSELLYNVSYFYGESDGSDAANAVGRILSVEQGSATWKTEDYAYDELGHLSSETKEVNIPDVGVKTYNTTFAYDSFGRTLEIAYPDDDKVSYDYTALGSLESISSQLPSEPIQSIIDQIIYDGYDNINFIEYGNGTETEYTYHDFTRSLTNTISYARMNSSQATNKLASDRSYTYNERNMITQLRYNHLNRHMAGAGSSGTHVFDYTYDDQNRLTNTLFTYGNVTSAYDLTMTYDDAGRIVTKNSDIINSVSMIQGPQLDYSTTYSYKSGSHMLNRVEDRTNQDQWGFEYHYNTSGSVEEIKKLNVITDTYEDDQVLVWNLEQQLVAVSNDQGLHHYVYDHTGERMMKSSFSRSTLTVDDQQVGNVGHLDPYQLYVNAYFVESDFANGLQQTKHYYMGMQRVVTDVSVFEELEGPGEQLKTDSSSGELLGADSSSESPIVSDFKSLSEKLGEPEVAQLTEAELLNAPTLAEAFPEYISSGENKTGDYTCCFSGLRYWYHPDYLGSVEMITNASGIVHQYFLTNPWGEEMYTYNPQSTGFDSPYRFNGKELDQETGLAYYGARYYNNRIGVWLSVDPMAMQGHNLLQTSYHFSSNNPVMRVDPNGMNDHTWLVNTDDGTYTYLDNEGGDEMQKIVFVNSEGDYQGTQFVDGPTWYLNAGRDGYYASSIDLWEGVAPDYNEMTGYEYSISDLKMRYWILNSSKSSHHLKVHLRNTEASKAAVPVTMTEFWRYYGHTKGCMLLMDKYINMANDLLSYQGGTAIGSRNVQMFRGRSFRVSSPRSPSAPLKPKTFSEFLAGQKGNHLGVFPGRGNFMRAMAQLYNSMQ